MVQVPFESEGTFQDEVYAQAARRHAHGADPGRRRSSWSTGLQVTANGTGVIAHARSFLPRLLADRVGLTAALSPAMGGRRNGRGHDRGRVLVDVAVAMADGMDTIRRMAMLSGRGEPFGEMASRSTVGRVLGDELDSAELTQSTLPAPGRVLGCGRR